MSSVNRWAIDRMNLDELHVSDDNPRSITNRNFQGLINSLKRFGQVEPIVWNKRTGKVVSGHQRLRALVDMGAKDAMVLVVDLPPEEERAANLTLNNPTIEGEFDDPITDLLKRIGESDQSMFKDLNFESLQKSLEKEFNRKTPGAPVETNGYLTKCPCCGNEWEVSASDVSMEGAD